MRDNQNELIGRASDPMRFVGGLRQSSQFVNADSDEDGQEEYKANRF